MKGRGRRGREHSGHHRGSRGSSAESRQVEEMVRGEATATGLAGEEMREVSVRKQTAVAGGRSERGGG